MREDYKNSLIHSAPPEPPADLFERIISAIRHEQELRQTRKLFFVFLLLFICSSAAMPFSWIVLVNQIKTSGISYFISAALSDLETFLNLWQNFTLAILESLPIIGLAVFTISLIIFLFTLKLFLYKKSLLFGYLKQSFT